MKKQHAGKKNEIFFHKTRRSTVTPEINRLYCADCSDERQKDMGFLKTLFTVEEMRLNKLHIEISDGEKSMNEISRVEKGVLGNY